ncbi:MAG: ABC transporter permease, partial [Tannerella sp.]|nr:ABC transporter permease [Tannerella sp.]
MILNVLGLSVAFAAFIVMMMKVNYEYGFDRCHPNADRIYRVDWLRNGEPSTVLPRAFADAVIASSPRIEEGTIIMPLDEWMGDVYLTTGNDAKRKGFHLPFETCYPGIARIFGFDFTEGNPNCLDAPGNAIIPQSIARRMFANETAIGKQLYPDNNNFLTDGQALTVGGVYRDFPNNTQMKNVIYTAIGQTQKNDWWSQNYLLYILFNDKSVAKAFEDHFNQTFDFSPLAADNIRNSIRLMPLTDIYFSGTGFKAGNVNTVRILFSIALLVIIIAAINCMNFSIAMTPVRMRSINTRKILGCSTATLRISMLCEALITAFVSWLLALFWVVVLTEGEYLSFMEEADLHLQNNVALVMLTGLAALVTGLVAGLYPAFYSTSLRPAWVLKGSFGLSPAGRKLRTALICFQYAVSICLIITAFFIQKQNRYLQNFDTGFDREHIAIVKLNADIYSHSRDLYAGKLKEYAGIDDVAFSKQKLGASDSYTSYGFKYNDREFGGYTLEVSENFLDVMRIPVIEGRSFFPSDTAGRKIAFVLNKPLKESVGVKAGEHIEMTSWWNPVCNVTGIADDVKFTSLRQGQD